MRRPAEVFLPRLLQGAQAGTPPPSESPREVHEYRAALMSVLLHTLSRDDPARLLAPAVQPIPLSQAIELIRNLPANYRPKARAQATYRLAVGIFVEEREEEFGPYLLDLLGAEEERALRAKLSIPKKVTPDMVFQTVYAPLSQRQPEPPPAKDDKAQLQEEAQEERHLPRERTSRASFAHLLVPQAGPPPQETQSTLDLETLTTTVRIRAPSLKDFEELRRLLDPRSWDESPFWPAAYQVELSPDGRHFNKVLGREVPGEPWCGYLFEHVEWDWNLLTFASFRNYLNISYAVSESPQQIRLSFSLYACEGSQLFLREARNGIDVDRGFLNVDHAGSSQASSFRIDTEKAIRFSDILDRRTPFEGPAGSGQILSLLAPAVVGLWLHDLVASLYFPSSQVPS